MNTIKKLSGFSATLLMVASMGSAYAEDADMSQTRTQDRVRSEINLQTPTSDFVQSRLQKQELEQKMQQHQSQNRHQYQYRNKFQTQHGGAGANSMNRQNIQSRAMGGSRR